MIFFTDENISPRIARMLEAFDHKHEIRPHVMYFDAGTPDAEWISGLASWDPKPVVVGGDGRILRNKVELAALKRAQLTFVYLSKGWTNLPWADIAWKIVKVWPTITSSVVRIRKPTVFEVTCGKTMKMQLIAQLDDL